MNIEQRAEIAEFMPNYLERLVNYQRHEEPNNELIHFPDPHNYYPILAYFTQSDLVYKNYLFGRKYFEKPRDEDDYIYFKRYLSGRLFESIATSIMAQRQPQDHFLFTPSNTIKVFQTLYPQSEMIDNFMDSSSLNGISTSDGLIVDLTEKPLKIKSVLEATLTSSSESRIYDYLTKKFRAVNYLKNDYPTLFGSATLRIVTPMDSKIYRMFMNGDLPTGIATRQIQIDTVPFYSSVFGNYCNFLMSDYRPSPEKWSLEEIRARHLAL